MPDSVFRCVWAQSALSEHQEYHVKERPVPCTYDRVPFKHHTTENELSTLDRITLLWKNQEAMHDHQLHGT